MKEIIQKLTASRASISFFIFALLAACGFYKKAYAESAISFAAKNLEYFNFSSSANFTLPKESSGKEKALSLDAGFQLKTRMLDLRFYRSLPKTALSKIEERGSWSEKLELLEDFRYGGAVSLFQKSTPLTFKLGMNSFSRSISRLKSPAPSSSSSALKKSLGFSSGIGISLPSLSSAVKPQSMAFSVEVPLSKTLEFDFQGFATEEKESAFSAQGKINLSRITFLEISATLARFYIENNSKILKKNYCGFSPDFFYAASLEASFKSPLFKSNFYSGIHENPLKENEYEDFYDFNLWIKSENRLVFKNFLLDFSYFAVPTSKNSPRAVPLISLSSSICRTLEQWSVNPQILISFNDKNLSTLRFGTALVNIWKITSNEKAEEYQSAKIKGGILYENRFSALKCEYSLENLILGEEPAASSSLPEKFHGAKISVSSRTSKLNLSASAACKFYFEDDFLPVEKRNYAFTLNISPKSKILSASSSLSLTREGDGKKTETSGTFSSSCNIKIKTKKKIRASCKIGLSVPF